MVGFEGGVDGTTVGMTLTRLTVKVEDAEVDGVNKLMKNAIEVAGVQRRVLSLIEGSV